MKPVLTAFIALILTSSAFAEFRLELALNVQRNNHGLFYNAYVIPLPFPDSTVADFETGLIEAENGQGRVQTDPDGWLYSNHIGTSSFADLISAISQPWHILLDEGLPTERRYAMLPEFGSLSEIDMSPPEILSPLPGGTVSTQSPVFEMNYPELLHAVLRNSQAIQAETYLSPGDRIWAPPLTLKTGKEYVVDALSDVSFPMGFTTPLDELGNPIPGWSTGGRLERWTSHTFTAVPEPATNVLAVLGAASVLAIGRRAKKRRLSAYSFK